MMKSFASFTALAWIWPCTSGQLGWQMPPAVFQTLDELVDCAHVAECSLKKQPDLACLRQTTSSRSCTLTSERILAKAQWFGVLALHAGVARVPVTAGATGGAAQRPLAAGAAEHGQRTGAMAAWQASLAVLRAAYAMWAAHVVQVLLKKFGYA